MNECHQRANCTFKTYTENSKTLKTPPVHLYRLWLCLRMSMISLLLHKSKAKLGISVNNKIPYKCTQDVTGLLPKT